MFERWTEQGRQVIVLAQDEARGLHHHHIGTEHLLLGLLRKEEGIAAKALASLGVNIARVRVQLGRIAGVGADPVEGLIPFTPRTKKVCELALREALSLGHNYISTHHILLGLVRENEGGAARILQALNVDSEKVRTEVMRLLFGSRRSPSIPDTVQIKLSRGVARALRDLVGQQPHTEVWSKTVYDSVCDALGEGSAA